MATYLFNAFTAAACLMAAAGPQVCFASDGADDTGGAGAGGGPEPTPAPPAAAEPAAPRASRQKMVTAVVRHGTVVVGDHGEEEHVGPGGSVTLTEAEVIKLRARGVLHDPESDPVIQAGPTVDNDLVEPKVRAAKTPARARGKR